MEHGVTAYPLCWPSGWPRTSAEHRKYGKFGRMDRYGSSYPSKKDITISQALGRIQDELRAFDGPSRSWRRIDPNQTVISTNLQLRLDGLPRSDQREPADPGAALYFVMNGKRQCVPCDAYKYVAQNLAAIAATLNALRALERHGSGLMERAFTGFAALPNPASTHKHTWWEVLGVSSSASNAEVEAAFKKARIAAHPDKQTGSTEKFHEVQAAYEAFCKERRP